MDQLTPVETEGSIGLADEPQANWPAVFGLPTAVLVAVPVPAFRVRDLLALKAGSILSSAWRSEREVPLLADGCSLPGRNLKLLMTSWGSGSRALSRERRRKRNEDKWN